MPKALFLILILFSLQSLGGNPHFSRTPETPPFVPSESTVAFKLGERTIYVKTYQYGNARDVIYINLHDDEVTAINGAKKLLEKKGGTLIKIENYRTRNIKFRLDGKNYTIDPNRMFSRKGIAQSLLLLGNTSPKAIDEIEKFANNILKLFPRNLSCIVALHNNGNGKFSVNTYLQGGPREKDAKALNVNPDLDADDFFLTTDSILYEQLAAEKYNTILQDNEKAKKDGSLSVYCGEKNIQYINCETEHGRQEQYDEMIVLAVNKIGKSATLPKTDPGIIAYNYRIIPSGGYVSPRNDSEIFFGEKKVGTIKSSATDSAKVVTGKLEMNKTFPLYSNMDLFVFLSTNTPPRFEVRTDPTRPGILLNPSVSPVSIGIRTTK